MSVQDILSSLDEEISRLQQARQLLSNGAGETNHRGPRGPYKKAGSQVAPARKKRRISAEGRKRIAEAMRRRWAAKKKAA